MIYHRSILTNHLTIRIRVLLEKVILSQLVKNSPPFSEPKGSSSCSQQPATGPHSNQLIQSTTLHPNSLRSILILSSHLRLRLPHGSFLSFLPTHSTNAYIHFPCYFNNCDISTVDTVLTSDKE